MKTVFMMKGLPASGKSTKAKEMLAGFGAGNAKRVNKDDLRAMLDNEVWSRNNEKFVLQVRDYIVTEALDEGKHVIVDDTNLAPKHENALRLIAKKLGAAFEVLDMTDVPVDECIKRDLKRANSVGEKVIRSMWKQFLAPAVVEVKHDENLPDCIIVDIDGTIAKMNGRGPFDWDKVHTDVENRPVCDLVDMMAARGIRVLYVSGRDESCRKLTEGWIDDKLGDESASLFMRPAGDMRDDRIIKREIYEREILGKYNVLFVLDDRNKVVEQWRQMGLPCFQVADGDF